MNNQYYVQVIAGNYLKNVVDAPASLKVHRKFLRGLDEEAFERGYMALLSLVRNLYADIATDPAGFGMLLKENAEENAKNADYVNSNASFVRVPNLLLILGARSEIQPDLSLSIGGDALLSEAKAVKITGVSPLLAKLGDYGFEITGFNKTVKSGDTLRLSFPDNRALTSALKAMAEAQLELNKGDIRKSKNFFYMVHGGLLESEQAKSPKLSAQAIFHVLSPKNREIAVLLHESVSDATKQDVRMGGFSRNDWSCVYTGKKSKKVLMSLKAEQDKLSVKLNLQHIGQYMPIVLDLPENIQDAIQKSGWECGGELHGNCSGPFTFAMNGKTYNKCRCGSFVFDDPSMKDVASYQELLKEELTLEDE